MIEKIVASIVVWVFFTTALYPAMLSTCHSYIDSVIEGLKFQAFLMLFGSIVLVVTWSAIVLIGG